MKFSVMGCGRWGSFIAWYLHKIGHEVCVWGRQGSANLAALQQGHMAVSYTHLGALPLCGKQYAYRY